MANDELTDEESKIFLQVVRNNTRNNVKRLRFGEKTLEVVFTEESTLDPVTLDRSVVLGDGETKGWGDSDWQAFFEKHEPLM